MILGKINLNEETDLDFALDIFGTSASASKARFVIEGKDFDVACHCEMVNGEIKAKIPKLKGILPDGVYEAILNVEVDGKIFTPMREQIELNPLVEFDVVPKKPVPVKEGVKVSMKTQIVSEDLRDKEGVTNLELNIQKAIKEGYEISKVGEHYIMKQGEFYVGLISEAKILQTNKKYPTLSSLIDGLAE